MFPIFVVVISTQIYYIALSPIEQNSTYTVKSQGKIRIAITINLGRVRIAIYVSRWMILTLFLLVILLFMISLTRDTSICMKLERNILEWFNYSQFIWHYRISIISKDVWCWCESSSKLHKIKHDLIFLLSLVICL